MKTSIVALAALLVACGGTNAAVRPQPSFSIPYGLAVAPGGAIFIADGGSKRLLRYEARQRRTTVVARGFGEPVNVERTADGTLFVSDLVRNRVVRIHRGRATTLATVEAPAGLALRGTSLYVSSLASFVYRVDLTSGTVERVAGDGTPESSGDGGPALAAQVETPHSVALDREGHLYLEAQGSIRRIDAGTGMITTHARVDASQMTFGSDGTLYFVHGDPRFGGGIGAIAADGTVRRFYRSSTFLPTDMVMSGNALLIGQSQPFPAVRRYDVRARRFTTVLRGR